MLLILLSLPMLALGAGQVMIEFSPSVKYVQPGNDFDLTCQSDAAATVKIFGHDEVVPSMEEAKIMNKEFNLLEKVTTINDYFNAKVSDSGIYTCVVMHGPLPDEVSMGTVEVIVRDLCASSNCDENEVCEANYDAGTAQCLCPEDMCEAFLRVFEPLCTDTCEQFFNTCHLKETMCKDKKPRFKVTDGFCPAILKPTTRQQDLLITSDKGEVLQLHSGLITKGSPPSKIEWTFTPVGGVAQSVSAGEVLSVAADVSGVYESKISHCANEAVRSTYDVTVVEKAIITTAPWVPQTEVFTNFETEMVSVEENFSTEQPEILTAEPEQPDELGVNSCGVYNNGVMELFGGAVAQRALNCHHVLAAEPENAWFIYGKFDADSSLLSMSFYVKQTVFEIQRGWVVNNQGAKLILSEGEASQVGDCAVTFADLHLNVKCPAFNVIYDGMAMGYINKFGDSNAMIKMGLCYGTEVPAGYSAKANWQVGNTAAPCLLPAPKDCDAVDAPQCGAQVGALAVACKCAGAEANQCELDRAQLVKSFMVGKASMSDSVGSCPDDCEWKQSVVDAGCPQPDATFLCNDTDF